MGISVLVASSGRPSLERTLASISPQLHAGDELLVDVNAAGLWGHPARNDLIAKAEPGNWLMHIDDDDVLADDALETVRRICVEPVPHIFRMEQESGKLVWTDPEVRLGNVGTPMMVAPNVAGKVGEFGLRHGGDFDYVQRTVNAYGGDCCWHLHVIAHVRPKGAPPRRHRPVTVGTGARWWQS